MTTSFRAMAPGVLEGSPPEMPALVGVATVKDDGELKVEVDDSLVGELQGTIYTIKAELGKGGQGKVYLAGASDGERYALKSLIASDAPFSEREAAFQNEIECWVMLGACHRNVVHVRGIDSLRGFTCVLLEYVEAGSLDATLEARGDEGMPLTESLELSLQFCDGMSFVHEHLGIVHRDIKPANCLVTGDGIKVGDFGLSLPIGTLASDGLYTQSYAAPEQLNREHVTRTTDVFAFGVMLFEMISGEGRFGGGSATSAYIRERVKKHKLPARLEDLIFRCVAPLQDNRPSDFGHVRATLAAVYEEVTKHPAPDPAVAFEPTHIAWNLKALTFLQFRKYEEALRSCNAGLKLAPFFVSLLGNKGVTLTKLGRFEEARAVFDDAIDKHPKNPVLWSNKARVLLSAGEFEEALAAYETGRDLNPDDPTILANMAVALQKLGEIERALGCMRKACRLRRMDGRLWRDKLILLMTLINQTQHPRRQDLLVEALESIEVVISLLGDSAELSMRRIKILKQMEELNETDASAGSRKEKTMGTFKDDCCNGILAAVRFRLAEGLDPNCPSHDRATGMHWSAYCSQPAVLKLLLDHGANCDAPDAKEQSTPLHDAAATGAVECARILIAAGANPNAENSSGFTPLTRAAFYGHPMVARLLLEAGANHRILNKGGYSILTTALMSSQPSDKLPDDVNSQGCRNVVKALVEADADLDAGKPSARVVAKAFGLSKLLL